ncbi:MAG: glycosyltransferase [Candidatus Cloacimonadia bacterium]
MNSRSDQVLYIKYFFPPLGGIAPIGGVKLAKYLLGFEIQPIILTVKPVHYFAYDFDLLDELPASVPVYRTASLDLNRLLYIAKNIKHLAKRNSSVRSVGFSPSVFNERLKSFIRSCIPIDEKIGWLPFSLVKGLEIINKSDAKAIIVSIPPYHTAITGWILHKLTSLPLILEYADLWTLTPYPLHNNPLFRMLEEWAEQTVLKDAAYLTVTAPTARKKMRRKYPFLKKIPIDVLFYGWDRDDVAHLNFSKRSGSATGPIRIGYAGTFSGYQTPKYLLEALDRLLTQKLIRKDEIELHFIGNFSDEIQKLFKRGSIQEMIQIHPFMPHKQCLEFLTQMDYVAIFLGGKEKSKGVIPAKLYDYFAIKVPVIGLCPTGSDLAYLLHKHGFPTAEFDDVKENMELIMRLLQERPNRVLTDEELLPYERNYIYEKLAIRIKKIIS